MHIDLNITSILFRGTLFCLFAYKIYQLFIKEKLRVYLDRELQATRNEQVELVEKDTLLLSTRKRLEGQLSVQKQLFVALEKKYAQFVEAERELYAEREKETVLRITSIIAKREQQQQHLSQLVALRAVVPEVVNNARRDLIVHYDDKRGGKVLSDYLKTLA